MSLIRLVLLLGLTLPILVVSPMCVLVKLSQVSFVGEPPAEWSVDQVIQFFAFINSLIGMDGSKGAEKRMLDSLLFFGEDAEEDTEETNATVQFHVLITAHLIDELGFYDALVARSRLTAAKMQSILIKDYTHGKINKESEWTLCTSGRWHQIPDTYEVVFYEYYWCQIPNTYEVIFSLKEPKEGVKTVWHYAKADEQFQENYRKAEIAQHVEKRREEIQSEHQLNTGSRYTLLTDGYKECYVLRNADKAKREYLLKMPKEGVSEVTPCCGVGDWFKTRYEIAEGRAALASAPASTLATTSRAVVRMASVAHAVSEKQWRQHKIVENGARIDEL